MSKLSEMYFKHVYKDGKNCENPYVEGSKMQSEK